MNSGKKNSILTGAVLTISMRWTDRLIGFVSTLILARLLAPADFGIIAMASMVTHLIDVLLDLGVGTALIQNREATKAHYDTAWTLKVAQTSLAAIIVVVAAPLAATYFRDPRVEPVLQVMAIGMVLAGLENIGLVTFQKEMRFDLDFRFMFSKRIVGFFATMIAAWYLHSYWALVIGTLAFRGFGLVLSYRMHPMRPRLSLEKVGEIFGFSQWVLLNNIGSFLNNNLHKLAVGRRTSSSTLGGYTLADEIAAMPTTEILAPLNRVLFPAFVEAKSNPAELRRVFMLAQGIQTLMAIPACVGLALVAKEAVALLLGDKWGFAIPFVQLLAAAHVVQAITTSGWYLLLTLGKAKNLAAITWFQVISFALVAFVLLPSQEATEIALIRIGTITAGLVLAVWMLTRSLPVLRLIDILRTITRPVLASLAMAATLIWIDHALALPSLAMLLVKIAAGAATYLLAIASIWLMLGRPSGGEDYILKKLQSLRRR